MRGWRGVVRWGVATALWAVTSLWSDTASALVPPTVTHQGRLFDGGGAPFVGTVDVQFAIYDAIDALDPLWIEVHNVTFDEGYFSVQLGSIEQFGPTLFDGSSR